MRALAGYSAADVVTMNGYAYIAASMFIHVAKISRYFEINLNHIPAAFSVNRALYYIIGQTY